MLKIRLPSRVYATLRLEADAAGISVAAYIALLLTNHANCTGV